MLAVKLCDIDPRRKKQTRRAGNVEETTQMKTKQKRWMKSVLATSLTELPEMPFRRGHRPTVAARLTSYARCQLRRA